MRTGFWGGRAARAGEECSRAGAARAAHAFRSRMTKNARLTRADFSAVEVSRRRFHGTLFSLSVSALPQSRRSSFACVVSKRVAGKAVQRNLIKRRCREAVRERMYTHSTPTPLALVFRAKKTTRGATFADIARDIRMLVDKISDTGYNTPQ